MKLCTVDEMQHFTREAAQRFQLAPDVLAENVGAAVIQVLSGEIGVTGKKFLVLCGKGERAAYGFAAARHLYAHGGQVSVSCLDDPATFEGSVQQQFTRLASLPVECFRITPVDEVKLSVAESDLVIDALLDSGTADAVTDFITEIIDILNARQRPVLSLDLPTGVHADTGGVPGAAVRATFTLACGIPKIGHLVYPGYEHCGKIYVTRMSLPPDLYDSDALQIAMNIPPPLPTRSATGHKGTFGDVLVIAGAGSYYGAPYFSASAVMKAGGGYSRLAAPAAIIPVIASKGSELVFVPQQATTSGSLALHNLEALLELVDKVDLVILGPGLSLHDETQELVRKLTASVTKPLLLDGDGITAVSHEPSLLENREAETILTPHLGEMARITGKSVRDIQADPIAVLQTTAQALNAFIVLKGAHSLIGYPDGRVFVNMSGNSGMGTAGSGDVLTGTLAAMFGLGLPIPDAVRKGVFLHGLAGDLAAQEKGEDGITAQDILDYLPLALTYERTFPPEDLYNRYQPTLYTLL